MLLRIRADIAEPKKAAPEIFWPAPLWLGLLSALGFFGQTTVPGLLEGEDLIRLNEALKEKIVKRARSYSLELAAHLTALKKVVRHAIRTDSPLAWDHKTQSLSDTPPF